MSTAPAKSTLNPQQERRWFRVWIAGLLIFFLVGGGGMAWNLWRAKRAEREDFRLLLDAAATDPGVTAAVKTDTSNATPVTMGIYLERISELSIKDATWTAVFDLWFRWQGAELNPVEGLVVMDGTIESRDKLAETHDGDRHYARYRIVAKLTKPFSISRFPLDEHLLLLAIENGGLTRDKLLFVPDLENSSVSSRVKVPGYDLTGRIALEKPHSYKTTRGDPRLSPGTKSTYSQFRFGINLERSGWGLYFKMFQALYIAVAIAFLACFIKPTDVDPRFGLGVGALFAAVANSYLVGSFVPDTGEQALADVVNFLGILTILVTLIESTVSLYLYDRCGEVELSQRLDMVSFKLMFGGFIAANVLLILAACF